MVCRTDEIRKEWQDKAYIDEMFANGENTSASVALATESQGRFYAKCIVDDTSVNIVYL